MFVDVWMFDIVAIVDSFIRCWTIIYPLSFASIRGEVDIELNWIELNGSELNGNGSGSDRSGAERTLSHRHLLWSRQWLHFTRTSHTLRHFDATPFPTGIDCDQDNNFTRTSHTSDIWFDAIFAIGRGIKSRLSLSLSSSSFHYPIIEQYDIISKSCDISLSLFNSSQQQQFICRSDLDLFNPVIAVSLLKFPLSVPVTEQTILQ